MDKGLDFWDTICKQAKIDREPIEPPIWRVPCCQMDGWIALVLGMVAV